MDIHNIHVVYTKEAETADNYIEKFAHDHHQKYEITVATSDHLEQIIITGQGCHLISARELEKIVKQTEIDIREQLEQKKLERNTLADIVKKAVEEKND
jgi:predicted RNA-binding protein with PIN domain